mmetsp:Transcript_33986/g.105596  ORF Transcript_33986/g.105596 Transcript_33986/m.105596 type:complete len:292 (+) Transcript_33986:1272-2147(+)
MSSWLGSTVPHRSAATTAMPSATAATTRSPTPWHSLRAGRRRGCKRATTCCTGRGASMLKSNSSIFMQVSALALRTRFSSDRVFASQLAPNQRMRHDDTKRRSETVVAKAKRAMLSWRITRDSPPRTSIAVQRPRGMRRTAEKKVTMSWISGPMLRSQMQIVSTQSATPVVRLPTNWSVYPSMLPRMSICVAPTCKDWSLAQMALASDVLATWFALRKWWAVLSRNLSMSFGLREPPLTKLFGLSSSTTKKMDKATIFINSASPSRKDPPVPQRSPCPINKQLSHTLALHA